MKVAQHLATNTSTQTACLTLGIPRATYYRWQASQAKPKAAKSTTTHPLTLSQAERQVVLNVLYSERFVDKSPGEIVPTLLDEGVYYCSERTMYRLLADDNALKERRQRTKKGTTKSRNY